MELIVLKWPRCEVGTKHETIYNAPWNLQVGLSAVEFSGSQHPMQERSFRDLLTNPLLRRRQEVLCLQIDSIDIASPACLTLALISTIILFSVSSRRRGAAWSFRVPRVCVCRLFSLSVARPDGQHKTERAAAGGNWSSKITFISTDVLIHWLPIVDHVLILKLNLPKKIWTRQDQEWSVCCYLFWWWSLIISDRMFGNWLFGAIHNLRGESIAMCDNRMKRYRFAKNPERFVGSSCCRTRTLSSLHT